MLPPQGVGAPPVVPPFGGGGFSTGLGHGVGGGGSIWQGGPAGSVVPPFGEPSALPGPVCPPARMTVQSASVTSPTSCSLFAFTCTVTLAAALSCEECASTWCAPAA